MTVEPSRRVPRFGTRRRAWDLAVFLFGFFSTTLAIANVPRVQVEGSLTDAGVMMWLVSIGAWATVFTRRTRPWLVAGAGLVLAVVGSEYLLFLVGMVHVLLAVRGRRRALAAGAVVAVVALYWMREVLTPWGGDVFDLDDGSGVSPSMASAAVAIVSLGVTGAVVALSASARATASAQGRVAVEQARAAELGDEVARQAEREEIAREIHDGLTNRLALLAMMGGNVERAVDDADPHARELARQLTTQSREALTDLRGLVQGLRAGPAAPPLPRGSMRQIPALVADVRAAGTTLNSTILLDGTGAAPAALDAAVHRMVQEALTNAVKHAPGSPVSLYLEAAPGTGVRLRVQNPLVPGVDPRLGRGAGTGLLGIGERASALDGTAWTGAHEGDFIVDVTLPWTLEPAVSDPDHTLAP